LTGVVRGIRVTLVAAIAALLLWQSAPPQAVEPAGAASAVELASRYAKALAQKDANVYVSLVCWDRVLPRDREGLETGFGWQASGAVSNVRFLTIEQVDQEARKSGGRALTRTPVKRDGVTYDFNLSVIGYVVYEFKSPDSKSEGTGAVPVGMKDGRYFVTTRVPLP
jgi:hypothetical protein